MTYQQTLEYLYKKLPMFSRIGAAAFKKDLTNTIKICEALGNPQNKFKSIHVAGTNGKGSVSHTIASVLQTTGYRTGLYTSPHLKDFRERIKIDGKFCEEDFVIDFVQRVEHLIEEIEPSFFEITVAMAFDYFAGQNVDVAVIEVGLGGRLDSTNIIRPELSIITNIGFDHMNLLGNSLEQIAFEKAGIIKENTPVVVGELIKETKPVFEEVAKEKQAPLIFAQDKRYVSDWKYQHHQLLVTVADIKKDEQETYQLDLPGLYQTKNIITVLEAVHQLQLKEWKINEKQLAKGLSNVKKLTGLHGRWEVIYQNPAVVLDVAHNEDGIKQVVEQLELTTYRQLHIIIGMVKDKQVNKILSLLPKTAAYYFTKAQIPRALPEEELGAIAASLDIDGKIYAEVNQAIKDALQHAQKDDLILVCGSVFLIGEVDTALF